MTTQTLRGGPGNFAAYPRRAVEAGRKGGQASGGNFRNDPERAKEAGRKGGKTGRRK
ncbi:general stress protein [Pantoea stewartii]|uniref:general stress protein n=1 Tax=Pantoea stewartii TaxID=66269 RepID=UPI0025A24528|nr:general stress protein [Pantoea stewartii]